MPTQCCINYLTPNHWYSRPRPFSFWDLRFIFWGSRFFFYVPLVGGKSWAAENVGKRLRYALMVPNTPSGDLIGRNEEKRKER